MCVRERERDRGEREREREERERERERSCGSEVGEEGDGVWRGSVDVCCLSAFVAAQARFSQVKK